MMIYSSLQVNETAIVDEPSMPLKALLI